MPPEADVNHELKRKQRVKAKADRRQRHADWIAAAREQAERARGAAGPVAPSSGLRLVLPDYAIVREVHRGGQGVVYEARQKSIPRTVALKVMRDGPFASEADRVCFEREISILAHVDHRNIVGILDRGDANGIHYLVMDFVDGRPLDRYAREQGLDLRERLRLFAIVCDAVNAAHLRGVIHRDLKPGNILIDALGEPHILDFGLATMVDRLDTALATITGQFVGSLPWVSPEQAMGRPVDVDIRSDVYSLGVMLYQLLTDRLPYSTIGRLDEVLNNIRQAEPIRPRVFSRQIDSDLETITLKCLAKKPARRYQSVSELVQDVRHYLAGEPIEARRDSTLYVLRKTLTRHRAATAVVAAFIIVVSVGLVVAVTLWRRASQEQARAEDEAAKATAVNAFLQETLAAASPEIRPGHELSVRQLLEASVVELDAGSLAGRPHVEAAVRATIGDTYRALGRNEEARAQLEKALAQAEVHEGASSDAVVSILLQLSAVHRARDAAEQAEETARRAVEISRSTYRGGSLVTVEGLQALALAVSMRGRNNEVVTLRREAVAMMERLLGVDDPKVLQSRGALAVAEHDAAGSEALVRRLIAVHESTPHASPPRLAQEYRTLAGLLHIQGDYAQAEGAYRRALEITRAVYGPDNPKQLELLFDLSFLRRSRGDAEQGEQELAEAAGVARRAYGPNDSRFADYLVQLAAVALQHNEADKAEEHVRQVLAMDEQGNPPDHWTRAQARSLMGEILLTRGQYAEAEPFLLAGYEELVRSGVPGTFRKCAAERLVRLYHTTGPPEKARLWEARANASRACASP